ncbi:MAG: alpha/beta fold hydrolase [Chloroflexi bacterium]|nr:alpha/beta fold hydrolase [Chloroflexota bacterium]
MNAQATPQFDDRYVTIQGIRLRYWQAGDSGTPVLLLHGLNGCAEHWRATITGLMGAHRVWALDGPGHGLSAPDDRAFDSAFMRDLVVDFLHSQGLERASIMALSGSGLVALTIALDRPEVLDRLVLVDAAGLGRGVNFRMRLMSVSPMPPPSAFAVTMSRVQLRYWIGQIFFADASKVTDEVVEEFYINVCRPHTMLTAARMMRWGINLLGQKHQFAHRLREIKAPTLVVWGKQDRLLPLAHAYRAAKRIPNARAVIFDPCGHLPMTERPDDFNRVVLEFLAGR